MNADYNIGKINKYKTTNLARVRKLPLFLQRATNISICEHFLMLKYAAISDR